MNPKRYSARSPTRIDLAGGTLDLWPLHSFVGGATTINFGIDIFTEAELTFNEGPQVDVTAQNQTWTFANVDELSKSPDPLLTVLQQVLRAANESSEVFKQKGFTFRSSSMSPVGGGLGGSSSLLVTYLKVFSQIVPELQMEPLEQIFFAHNLEARILRTPTGTQDYFPPVFSGLNFIRYGDRGSTVEVSSMPSALRDSFFLVYTGRPHHSGLNNFDVIRRAVAGERLVFEALIEIREIASDLERVLREGGDWDLIPELLNRENKARIKLSPGFSSPEIEKLEALVRGEAAALKICGAGGGGCVFIWAASEKHAKIQMACQNAGYQILKTKAVDPSLRSGPSTAI